MSRSMRLSAIIFLVLTNLLLILFPDSCCAQEYDFQMRARGREVTGLLIVENSDEGYTIGTIINEFGIKVFDFTYNGKKAKVSNVLGPLDRWYIRKVLNKDVTFILANINNKKDVTVKKRSIKFHDNGNIVIENRRFKIQYTLSINCKAHETTE